MAFNVLYYPYDIHSVYRPVVYKVSSTNYAAPNIFNSLALINSIGLATAQERADYDLATDTVVVRHSGLTEAAIAGQYYRLHLSLGPNDVSGTNRYPGAYRVERVLTSTSFVISATYVGFTTTGGTLHRVLGNYTVFAKVSGPNIPVPVEYAIKPVLGDVFGQQDYVFELDCRDVLARHFKDVKAIASRLNPSIVDAEGYITQRYSVTMREAYDVIASDGTATFTRFEGVEDPLYENIDQVCVNAVHPYHHVERDGTVNFDYVDSFDTDYTNTLTASTTKRFLTYMDRTATPIRRGDSFFLSFLKAKFVNGVVRYSFTFEGPSGLLGTAQVGGTNLPRTSYMLDVGAALNSAPAGTTTMKVRLSNAAGQAISETFTFKVQACKGINKRWYYLNKLGGVDAFTFEGEETRQMTVRRDTISKPSMALPDTYAVGTTFRGDWQQRVWRTEPQRKYTLSSGYLLPLTLRTIAEEMFESPNIFTEVQAGYWTNIIPLTSEVPGDSDSGRAERFVIQYQLGVDNLTQRT
jgi:hypothetical protein